VQNDQLTFAVSIKNHSKKNQSFTVNASICSWEKPVTNDINMAPDANGVLKDEVLQIENASKIELKAGDSIVINLSKKVNGSLKNWTPESPNLYGSIISLKSSKKTIADIKYTRFGWRQFTIKGTEFLLNGKPIVLKGDSWHFMGIPQLTRRYAWAWFTMLEDANANAVRLHAQPYPSFYLDMADEMGICVLDETGIWSSDGGPKMDSDAYWAYCKKHVKSLVMRDRNHPAVFGWSVCNETLPVAIYVFHAPEAIVQRQVDEINNWVAIVKASDPTRDWISGDGEDMRPTDLPTVIGHYGDENSMKKWSSEGKPWGVGETGMGYYGTPKQISAINGNRAYESQLGRMEGLATEAYSLISKQLSHKASYASVFNVIWYGLKPLPLGLNDISRPVKADDGIFFQTYEEGIPGMQPERLGPYTSTVNPGYDPTLPLYDPWPLFYAVQAANSAKDFSAFTRLPLSKKFEVIENDKLIFVGSEASLLEKKLSSMGVTFSKIEEPTDHSLVIIDGLALQSENTLKDIYKKSVNAGARVLIWGVSLETVSQLNGILPYPLTLDSRKSSSFIKLEDAPILSGLENSDFYFSEVLPRGKTAMNYGMEGEMVKHSTILLSACNTDWQCWNNRPEPTKTAGVFKSEQEKKGAGTVLITYKQKKSDVMLASFDFQDMILESESPIRLMLSNLGVKFDNSVHESKRALDTNGNLVNFKDEPDGLSFWVFSPRSLVDLLAEPDLPKLSMNVLNVKDFNPELNGENTDLNNIPLERGWNKFVIKFNQNIADNKQDIKVILITDRNEFFKQIDSITER